MLANTLVTLTIEWSAYETSEEGSPDFRQSTYQRLVVLHQALVREILHYAPIRSLLSG